MDRKSNTGRISLIKKVNIDTFKLVISSDIKKCKSGQYISILCPNATLRRPFSVSDFDEKTKQITILFKLKGEGTKYLSSLKIGDEVNFLGIMGNGFTICEKQKALLIGAGIGIAPMLFLKKELDKKQIENFLISGFKSNDEIIKGADKTVVGGSILDCIDEIITNKKIEVIYACGPKIVLKKLCDIAQKHQLPCQIALEKVMACSIGVCRGCVIKLMRDNEINNYSICKDGPIFEGSEILWD